MRHSCATPSLSVATLVQPVEDEDVATVEEDLVSNGDDSIEPGDNIDTVQPKW